MGKDPGTRAWLLLEVSRGEFFALQSSLPLNGLRSCASSVSFVALSGKKMVFPGRDAAVAGYVHRQCMSQVFHLISAICFICWQISSVCYLLPHQGAARPQQVPLCQGRTFTNLSFATQKFSPYFLMLIFLMERALEEPGRLTGEKQDRLCFNPVFLWSSPGTARWCSSVWNLCPQLLSRNYPFTLTPPQRRWSWCSAWYFFYLVAEELANAQWWTGGSW